MDMVATTAIRRWTIYCLTCLPTGKKYVGQTTKEPPSKRWDKHCVRARQGNYGCAHLAQAILRHGKESFAFSILATAQTQKKADRLEKFYIRNLEACDRKKGYNIQTGGVDTNMSEETREKISRTLMGHSVSSEAREKMKYKKSAEHRKKLSEATKRVWRDRPEVFQQALPQSEL